MNIAFHTLGCKLNFSETSFIANNMQSAGFTKVPFDHFADIYVINTCSVTENANKECQYLIRKALSINPSAKTVVMGCYAQLKPSEIAKIEGVNLVLGNNEKFKLNEYINKIQHTTKPEIITKNVNELNNFKSSFSFGTRTRSFLKVQDGCNYKCTFCTIPLARGKSRSDTIQNVISKIKKLKKDGIKEIVLTGINLGDFKTNENDTFLDLLIEIDKIKNIRVRISSIEPNLINEKIIDLVSQSRTLLPHFHIPLQSGSDEILKAMKRRYLTTHYKNVVKLIHNRIPHACIGVDVIVGFPGETDEHFNQTLSFLKELNISYLHVFSYSKRENTEAINMQNQIPVEIKKYRSKVLRNLSDKKRHAFYEKNIGSIQKVLFENKTNNGYIYGFSENYIKIKSVYEVDLENTLKKVKINNIEHKQTAFATGLVIKTK